MDPFTHALMHFLNKKAEAWHAKGKEKEMEFQCCASLGADAVVCTPSFNMPPNDRLIELDVRVDCESESPLFKTNEEADRYSNLYPWFTKDIDLNDCMSRTFKITCRFTPKGNYYEHDRITAPTVVLPFELIKNAWGSGAFKFKVYLRLAWPRTDDFGCWEHLASCHCAFVIALSDDKMPKLISV